MESVDQNKNPDIQSMWIYLKFPRLLNYLVNNWFPFYLDPCYIVEYWYQQSATIINKLTSNAAVTCLINILQTDSIRIYNLCLINGTEKMTLQITLVQSNLVSKFDGIRCIVAGRTELIVNF